MRRLGRSMGCPSDPPSAQAHMPSRPSGADKEKERAQNEGGRGAGVDRPLDRADMRARRDHKFPRSSVSLADSGKVRVNRSGLLLPESDRLNQALHRSAQLPIRAMMRRSHGSAGVYGTEDNDVKANTLGHQAWIRSALFVLAMAAMLFVPAGSLD